ncbi:Csu type fimbrial protein [Dyella solisilvae]|uniref:Csu type fimbrial protein n=1 Tax=Dyella solisilvae TaxID=1920168 RepID=UPI0013143BE5|nr:spore coat U domain-containing protein [Dyella solisilvae]
MPLKWFRARCRHDWVCLLVLALLALIPQPGRAQSCYVSGSFGMNFGAVTRNGGSSSSDVDIECSPDYTGANRTFYYRVCMYMGPGASSAGQPTRRMTNYNGSYLNYDLFADPAHTQLIGDVGSTFNYQVESVVPPGAVVALHDFVYGLVYPNQSVPASYQYQEVGILGTVRYRYNTVSGSTSPDCSSGGLGGGTTTFNTSGVLATFENSCTVTATDLDFGQVSTPTQAVNGLSTILVQCPANTTWQVGLDNGLNYNAGLRRMSGQGNFVSYQLYRDASRTQVWGNTPDAMSTGATDASGNPVDITVYGQVSAQPDAPAGQYADTVVVTLYY